MFLPRLASEFSPVFRLLDDYDAHCSQRSKTPRKSRPALSFTPKFDIRESNDGYHLDGELPGVNQDDIGIEFTDPHTLVIKGHSHRNSTNVREAMEVESMSTSDNSSTKSLQPTVEDEEAGTLTRTVPELKPSDEVEPEHGRDHYLVSERLTGEFHRSFTFPTRINHEGVKARLRNGILSVDVPREAVQTKKIRIE